MITQPSTANSPSVFLGRWAPDIDRELRRDRFAGDTLPRRMAAYHMGWVDPRGHQTNAAAGKQLRPSLCCWAAEACGGSASDALPVARAIELIHNFTLVHDDVQDGDQVRRGRPTVWSIWGAAQAINAGDYLFANALRALLGGDANGQGQSGAHTSDPDAARVVLDAVLEVIEGQCLDLEHEGKVDAGRAAYLGIVEAKTAALIGASMEAGAIVAGASPQSRGRLRRAGRLLGEAFQLRDDWLGIWGETARTGKSKESDLVRRKLTFPVAVAYDHANQEQREVLRRLYSRRGAEGEPEIRDLLDELGAADLTVAAASVRAWGSVVEVRRCGFDSSRVEEFTNVATYIAERST